eukprot:2017488-Rhodomonas_salina.1
MEASALFMAASVLFVDASVCYLWGRARVVGAGVSAVYGRSAADVRGCAADNYALHAGLFLPFMDMKGQLWTVVDIDLPPRARTGNGAPLTCPLTAAKLTCEGAVVWEQAKINADFTKVLKKGKKAGYLPPITMPHM